MRAERMKGESERKREAETLWAMLAEATTKAEEEKREIEGDGSGPWGSEPYPGQIMCRRRGEDEAGDRIGCRTGRARTGSRRRRRGRKMWRWGTGSPSPKTTADAATNTETTTRTYAQAVAHAQEEGKKEKRRRKDKSSNTPAAKPEVSEVPRGAAGHLQRFPFADDLSEYEEEEEKEEGTTTKAVVVHGAPTNWGSRLCGGDHGGCHWGQMAPQREEKRR